MMIDCQKLDKGLIKLNIKHKHMLSHTDLNITLWLEQHAIQMLETPANTYTAAHYVKSFPLQNKKKKHV